MRSTFLETDWIAELNNIRYHVLDRSGIGGRGGRAWDESYQPDQEQASAPLTVPFPSWHEGAGFSYANVPSTYDSAGAPITGASQNGDGWDLSTVGRPSSWARHAAGQEVTATTGRRGWLVRGDDGYFYMGRGRYVAKYVISSTPGTWSHAFTPHRDLGVNDYVNGRMVNWNGKVYYPERRHTTGALQVATEITPSGASDTYLNLPSTKTAQFFSKMRSLLVRGTGNGIATCATTPTTASNWSDDLTTAYQAGDPGIEAVDALQWDIHLLVAKEDGLWSFDENFETRNELPSLQTVVDDENNSPLGIGADGRLYVPSEAGLIAWLPGQPAFIGPEQEGALEGELTPGWGRAMGIAAYGDRTFVSYKDSENNRGSIVSFNRSMGGRQNRPHMHFQTVDGWFEDLLVVADASGGQYLVAIRVDDDNVTASPWAWRLPRASMSAANDPDVDHRVSNTSWRSGRVYAPLRHVQKTYRMVEFWLELDAAGALSNTPGLQVWASVDNGAFFQLLDDAGSAYTIKTEGQVRAWFPKTSAAVGHWVQFEFRVPATAGGETKLGVTAIRDFVLRGSYRPRVEAVIKAQFVLTEGEFDDKGTGLLTPQKQRQNLIDIAGPNAQAVPFKDVWGNTGYCTVSELTLQEVEFKGQQEPTWLASCLIRVEAYD